MASEKPGRGEMIVRSDLHKQNFITSERYSGKTNRSYENQPKYNIAPKKGLSYQINSSLSLERLQAKYPDAVVTKVVLNLME